MILVRDRKRVNIARYSVGDNAPRPIRHPMEWKGPGTVKEFDGLGVTVWEWRFGSDGLGVTVWV